MMLDCNLCAALYDTLLTWGLAILVVNALGWLLVLTRRVPRGAR